MVTGAATGVGRPDEGSGGASRRAARRARREAAERQENRRCSNTNGEVMNTWEQITTYNNYYEFGTDKDQPAELSRNFKTDGWMVDVEGECAKKGKFSIDDILKGETIEERVYRHRCVEAWSMVIPWDGIPLAQLHQALRADGEGERTSSSPRCSIPSRCRACGRTSSTGRTSKACAWTRPCIRSRFSSSASTARRCRTRTARRSGWSCRGSTGSRTSSRS